MTTHVAFTTPLHRDAIKALIGTIDSDVTVLAVEHRINAEQLHDPIDGVVNGH